MPMPDRQASHPSSYSQGARQIGATPATGTRLGSAAKLAKFQLGATASAASAWPSSTDSETSRNLQHLAAVDAFSYGNPPLQRTLLPSASEDLDCPTGSQTCLRGPQT